MTNTPLRFKTLEFFRESAKDMGDRTMIAAGVRLYWAMNFPRTKGHMATDADFNMLKEFEAEYT